MILQAAGTDLGALQILQDADGSGFPLGSAAEPIDIVSMVFVRAMGKVETGNVHPQAHQVAHRGLGVAGWADGADDFGATLD
jgi:hypothetical protein